MNMLSALFSFFLLLAAANAHMAMYSPCARYSSVNPSCPAPPSGQAYDYNIKSPIGTKDGIVSPLCKSSTPYSSPTETWNAGQSVTVSFQNDGAAHGGGHCQFSLSYDGGKTFVVVHDEKRYCFFSGPNDSNSASVLSYTFQLPSSVPAGDRVIFSWSWINAIGNREYYMNCADITIKSQSQSFSGPQMLIANYGPSYPVVPEFNGDYDTGLDLFDKRPTITVYSTGSSSNNGVSNNQQANRLPPTVNGSGNQSSQYSTPNSGSQRVNEISGDTAPPQQDQPQGACQSGQMKCDPSGNSFFICDNNAYVSFMVPPGTQCKDNGNGTVSFQ
ncbi:hypothetical protein BB560_004530 [Smittium megazygosporum]|uniref:Chitin-binding type-4 domain-containing protein n=1 Tax=Smittium megazygosporum TaxID=133381 RepID=A0A2T9Z914_9FUNG|nr:hypothetical protein BB560_004530 [Smittium megazygosporum]